MLAVCIAAGSQSSLEDCCQHSRVLDHVADRAITGPTQASFRIEEEHRSVEIDRSGVV
jgi:hypothetical protein